MDVDRNERGDRGGLVRRFFNLRYVEGLFFPITITVFTNSLAMVAAAAIHGGGGGVGHADQIDDVLGEVGGWCLEKSTRMSGRVGQIFSLAAIFPLIEKKPVEHSHQ